MINGVWKVPDSGSDETSFHIVHILYSIEIDWKPNYNVFWTSRDTLATNTCEWCNNLANATDSSLKLITVAKAAHCGPWNSIGTQSNDVFLSKIHHRFVAWQSTTCRLRDDMTNAILDNLSYPSIGKSGWPSLQKMYSSFHILQLQIEFVTQKSWEWVF